MTLQSIKALAEADPVTTVERPLTMHFGPHAVLLTMHVHFRDDLLGTELQSTVDRLEQSIRSKHPEINHIFIEAKSVAENKPRNQRPRGSRKQETGSSGRF